MTTSDLLTNFIDSAIEHRWLRASLTAAYGECTRRRLAAPMARVARSLVVCAALTEALAATPQASCSPAVVGDVFLAPVGSTDRAFGHKVVVSGDGRYLLASEPGYSHQGAICGAVWVVDRSNSGSQPQLLLPSPAIQDQIFGMSIAVSHTGNVAVAGGFGSGSFVPGRIRVFRRVGSSLTPSLDLSGNYHDYFGRDVSVSADGNTFVVSAPAWYGAGVDEGAIFTYDWNGSSWVQAAPIYPHTLPLGVSSIGINVELSPDGRTLAFSSPPHSLDTVRSGVVYVMQRSGNSWINPVRLTDVATYSSIGFGQAAALSHDGTILAVGNPNDGRVAPNRGAVVIFRRLQSSWIRDWTIFPSIYAANSVFGWSVALNATGTHLLVGEPGYPSSLGRIEYLTAPSVPGAAWSTVFEYIASGAQPIASGKSVAMSANAASWVVGEPYSDVYGTNAGRVLVFETPCLEPNIYCAGQANSLGCVAEIEASGTPSVSSASGFVVSTRNVRNQQNGMLIYSTTGRAQFAWQGGTLCVAPPLRRTPLVNSGGAAGASNDCSGVLSRDFNSWAISAGDPALIVGQQVRAQFYSRDPGAVANVNLSNAIEFTLEP